MEKLYTLRWRDANGNIRFWRRTYTTIGPAKSVKTRYSNYTNMEIVECKPNWYGVT